MYKGISGAYCVIMSTYWQLAFLGYWAFGSQVQPYIVASLTTPKWTTIMANLFAVIQISGCFQVGFNYSTIFFLFMNATSLYDNNLNLCKDILQTNLCIF